MGQAGDWRKIKRFNKKALKEHGAFARMFGQCRTNAGSNGIRNKKYLRVCAVYRLLKKEIINRQQAMKFLAERHSQKEMKILKGTVEQWFQYSLSHLARVQP